MLEFHRWHRGLGKPFSEPFTGDQQNKLLYVDKKNRVMEPFAMSAETAEEKDVYKKFYEQFAECSKPVTHENFVGDQDATEQNGYNT